MLPFEERDFEKILNDIGIPTRVKRTYEPKKGKEEGVGGVYSYSFFIRKKEVKMMFTQEVFEQIDKRHEDSLPTRIHLEVARYRLGLSSLVMEKT